MFKILSFLLIFFVYNNALFAMDNKPYHHLPDGTFRNPEGSPKREMKFNWSYKIFNKEKKKLDMRVPNDHVIEKNEVLKLRELLVANEHKNSELAFQSYEKAMSILN